MVCFNMRMKTQVVVIGGGPSGLLLSQLLKLAGIETVILERAARKHVLGRVRAGVLEPGTVSLLRDAGVAANLEKNGIFHDGCTLCNDETEVRIDFKDLTGKQVVLYGQTELTADLYEALDCQGTPIFHEVSDVELTDLEQELTQVFFRHDGKDCVVECQFVAGCDGFHGVSRNSIPASQRKTFERTYPFAWLGILAKVPPVRSELIYASSKDGFALASMRSEELSRCYVQVPSGEMIANWPDQRFWDTFASRLPPDAASGLIMGPSIDKTISAVRSFVCESMRWGNLFLVGDSAHIVPPTGAKGLNLAVSDVYYLTEALVDAFSRNGSTAGLDNYSARALARVWKAMRFSNEMTQLLHRFEEDRSFDSKLRRVSFQHLIASDTCRRDFAENYVGLPL